MSFIANVVSFVEASRYLFLFLGCFFEGTIAMITGGILVRFNEVQLWNTYAILIAADFTSDLGWYALGYWGARTFFDRWGRYIGVPKESLEKSEERFKSHQTLILVISKLTMGFGLAVGTLITAGMLRVSFIRYALIQFFCGLIWVGFLMAIGYFYGNILFALPSSIGIAVMAITVITVFFALRYATKRMAHMSW